MPVPTAGTFTAANLATIVTTADKVWKDNMSNPDYVANVEALEAIRKEQTASFPDLQDPAKDNTVKVVWIDHCDATLANCTNDCTIGGAELSADGKDYTLDLCKTSGFNIKEKALRSSVLTYDELVAKGLLSRMKLLDEWLAQQAIVKLEAFRGVAENLPAGLTWANASGDTEIPRAQWNLSLIPQLQRLGIMNRFTSPFLLSGSNLWVDYMNAEANMGNDNGKGDAARMKMFRTYFDLWNVDTLTAPDLKTYLVNRGAVAFVNKAYYGAFPTEYMTQRRYSIASRNLPGVRYDVVYTNECVSNEIIHKFSLYVKAGIFLNPTGCTETRTGIIALENKAPA